MKLVGYVNGIEVRFDFYPPHTFKAEFPRNLGGKYIVELHAVNDAGVETYQCNLQVLIDFDKLRFKILDPNYAHMEESNNLVYNENMVDKSYKEYTSKYGFMLKPLDYNYEEVPLDIVYKELI